MTTYIVADTLSRAHAVVDETENVEMPIKLLSPSSTRWMEGRRVEAGDRIIDATTTPRASDVVMGMFERSASYSGAYLEGRRGGGDWLVVADKALLKSGTRIPGPNQLAYLQLEYIDGDREVTVELFDEDSSSNLTLTPANAREASKTLSLLADRAERLG